MKPDGDEMTFRVMPNPAKIVNGQPVKVRDPITGKFIPDAGAVVPRTAYWIRRQREGDVILAINNPALAALVSSQVPLAPVAVADAAPEMTLQEAIAACLAAGDKAHLGKDGKPKCGALTNLTGRKITKADRDAAMPEPEVI